MTRRVGTLILAAFWMILVAGCGLPRIIVLEDPLTPDEHLRLGMAYEQQKEYEPALREYKAASKKNPLAHHLMGNVYFALNRFDQAEKSYRRAIALLPDHPDPRNNLAWLFYTRRTNLDEAEALAWKAVSLAPPEKRQPYWDTLDKIRDARTP